MRINEIVLESTELEEGWKSKVGAAALAGAAALGGGSADAGGGITLNVVGKSYDSQGNTIVKYQDGSTRNLGTNVWTAPTMTQQRQNQALAKQKADQAAAARASRQSNYAPKNVPHQRNIEPKFDPTQDQFLMGVLDQIDKDIGKFESNLESNPTTSEKNNLINQIDSRIKYYFDYIEDVKASRGISSEENVYLVKKIQDLSNLKDVINGMPPPGGGVKAYKNAGDPVRDRLATRPDIFPVTREKVEQNGKEGLKTLQEIYQWYVDSTYFNDLKDKDDIKDFKSVLDSVKSGIDLYKTFLANPNIRPVDQKFYKNIASDIKRDYDSAIRNDRNDSDSSNQKLKKQLDDVIGQYVKTIDDAVTRGFSEPDAIALNSELDSLREISNMLNDRLKKPPTYVIGEVPNFKQNQAPSAVSDQSGTTYGEVYGIMNKGNVGAVTMTSEDSGHVHIILFDVNSDVGKQLMALPKDFDGEIKYDFKEIKVSDNIAKDFQIQDSTALKIVKVLEIKNKNGKLVQSAKPDFKQNQAPSASQSPKSPEVKQADKTPGFEAKTTGEATGITKNGDTFSGEWKNGLPTGKGERTLVNKGYTGKVVKTGNKIDTEWKNGVPVDGASVKITTPDGKTYHGHIKRTEETPWNYIIVK